MNFLFMKTLLGLIVLIATTTVTAQKILITVNNQGRMASPVRINLSKPLLTNSKWQLHNQKTGRTIPAQLLDSTTLIFIPEEKLPVGKYTYTLVSKKENEIHAPVSIEKKENGLLVQMKGKPILFYHIKEAMPPSDSPAYYKRSGFIHPLYSPSGKILTDDFPVDHIHQHGVFTAWTSTRFKNTSIDFWNQQAKKGTVEHFEVIDVNEGTVASQIKTSLRHTSLEFGEVLREKWTITIYSTNGYFLFDLESEQQNITGDTLFLNSYHYGGLAFRGSRQWNQHDTKNYKEMWHILTSEGIKDSSANAKHVRWVDAWGKIDEGVAGVTVFNHPSNFRYPQAIRVHPSMPYWAYSPVVDGAFYIAPGGFYRSKFRYYLHDGEPQTEFIEKLFRDWASESNVKVTFQ
jgi:hypothetical protein